MTIYRTLLAKGYFPKEVPPAFFTEEFALYARTRSGRATLDKYTPDENFTESVKYNLALPGSHGRELRIVHPFSFSKMAGLVARNFSRLLKKCGRSKFAKSRPVYSPTRHRAIQPAVNPSNLARERAAARAGAGFLLKADVSQFYPSLYTHAVGWAVDPKLRARKNWKNKKFLGARLDQALMDSERKLSQGIPIGNDVSFLLAEAVLAEVDCGIKVAAGRAYRWFDDYEIAFDTREQAEAGLQKLNAELARFRLRLNPAKTKIIDLPQPTEDDWRGSVFEAARVPFSKPNQMVKFFDTAFRLREKFREAPILLYALGALFKVSRLSDEVSRIALSCITQAVLCEPGAAQKAFALLSFWRLNGLSLDRNLIKSTVGQMILHHRSKGPTSDIAWGLAFCLQENIDLDAAAARALCKFDDDCIAIQALDMRLRNLLASGFTDRHIIKRLKNEDLNRDHWLLAYESVRHNFLGACTAAVKGNALFSDLLARRVTFYRRTLPGYAAVLHPGGAPEWTVLVWLRDLMSGKRGGEVPEEMLLLELVKRDLLRLRYPSTESPHDAALKLLGRLEAEEFPAPTPEDMYTV